MAVRWEDAEDLTCAVGKGGGVPFHRQGRRSYVSSARAEEFRFIINVPLFQLAAISDGQSFYETLARGSTALRLPQPSQATLLRRLPTVSICREDNQRDCGVCDVNSLLLGPHLCSFCLLCLATAGEAFCRRLSRRPWCLRQKGPWPWPAALGSALPLGWSLCPLKSSVKWSASSAKLCQRLD